MTSRLLNEYRKLLAARKERPLLPSSLKFVDELRQGYSRRAASGPCGQFAHGVRTELGGVVPETAEKSLEKVLAQRHILHADDGVALRSEVVSGYEKEEYELIVTPDCVLLRAAGAEGFRRAVYALEELLLQHDSQDDLIAQLHRKAHIKNRVSRCFFSPTCRPPFNADELDDDEDYYPEPYLDRLAHEGVNGLWITMYLADMPSRFFPAHGSRCAAKLAKLRQVRDRCARYGIKIFIFLAEPKSFGGTDLALPAEEALLAPSMLGHQSGKIGYFCTSTKEGQSYLSEGIDYLFSHVRGLGGIINIMELESALPCSTRRVYGHLGDPCQCPRCAKRTPEALHKEVAEIMMNAMRRHEPEALFVGWFYFACFWKGDREGEHFLRIAEAWPKEAALMFNFECGGVSRQLGRDHAVLDYTLSHIEPSDLWLDVAGRVDIVGAKLQTACSHEDASVPEIPVPGNLFAKYRILFEKGCDFVMMCWYFGNVPGLMNRAAGRLAFAPLPPDEKSFLLELARADWGEDASVMAEAYEAFGTGYRAFPENLHFKWFGPLHQSLAYPWYLTPVDEPMAPSYTLEFPLLSGDRVGECTDYEHTPDEIMSLLKTMRENWTRGMKLLEPLRAKYRDRRERRREIALAEAIGIQIASTERLFAFYRLRENMIFERTDEKEAMRALILDEIADTLRMKTLCEDDPRLGFHSEVCAYLFYPEQLEMRKKLLDELLSELDSFDFDAPAIREYAGEIPDAPVCAPKVTLNFGQLSCRITLADSMLRFAVSGMSEGVTVELEPCRLYPVISMTAQVDGRCNNFKCDWQAERIGNEVVFSIDLDRYRAFRRSDASPVRFNVFSGSSAYRPHRPYPGRLLLGNGNSQDLATLRFHS